ncbi:MAG: hypothetical protein AAF616_12285 [Bacteroidota bacterium]
MKLFSFLIILLASSFSTNDPRDIAKVNTLKKEAEKAFVSGDYELAIKHYSFLVDSMNITDEKVLLNTGHAYYHTGDTAAAKRSYEKAVRSKDKKLKSIAYQQLGVLSKDANKLEEALQQLKTAIKSDPTNRDAIYDYEVVKKLIDKQKQNQDDQENQDQNKDNQEDQENQDQEKQDQENQDQKNQDQENQDQKDQQQQDQEKQDQQKKEGEEKEQEQKEGEKSEEEQEQSKEQMTKEKLEEMGISEEKARQLLEAMRQSEIKYLQNQKRKATKRPASGKPDW